MAQEHVVQAVAASPPADSEAAARASIMEQAVALQRKHERLARAASLSTRGRGGGGTRKKSIKSIKDRTPVKPRAAGAVSAAPGAAPAPPGSSPGPSATGAPALTVRVAAAPEHAVAEAASSSADRPTRMTRTEDLCDAKATRELAAVAEAEASSPHRTAGEDLCDAIARVRLRSPGATAREVHGALVEAAGWRQLTLPEVKKASSKMAKARKTGAPTPPSSPDSSTAAKSPSWPSPERLISPEKVRGDAPRVLPFRTIQVDFVAAGMVLPLPEPAKHEPPSPPMHGGAAGGPAARAAPDIPDAPPTMYECESSVDLRI